MKKPIFVFCTSLLSIFFLNAQTTNIFPDSGNVGIGTITPSSSYKLDVLGAGRFTGTLQANNGIFVYNNKLLTFMAYDHFNFYIGSDANKDALHIGYGSTLGANNQMTFDQTTNRVGIYNSNPSYTLDVTGTGRFTSNLLIGTPNGARTEINTSTNHKIFAPTNKKTIDLDGNYHGGGFVGVYRADNGIHGVIMESQPSLGHNGLFLREMRNDNQNINGIILYSTVFSGDTAPTNYISLPGQKSLLVIGENGEYKMGQNFGLINKLKTSFENDVYVETGNVGIGTTSPNSPLTIGYNNASNQLAFKRLDGSEAFSMNINSSNQILFKNHSGGGDYDFRTNIGGYGVASALFIKGYNGNVGIGTITPDEKLAVNGNIHTKEVRVDLIGWPDFVFAKDYNLPTLEEVEQHIQEKGHLKDIPSAKEVAENGILLGDMNAKLLQKIEELTLYTIEQQKLIEEQAKVINEIQQKLKD